MTAAVAPSTGARIETFCALWRIGLKRCRPLHGGADRNTNYRTYVSLRLLSPLSQGRLKSWRLGVDTGFDAKTCNTLYVDKNLRYHGLIQAFSRTNRILGQKKSQGNIVCFRNLKAKVDEAIALFSNRDADETILIAPYQEYADRFNEAVMELLKIAPIPSAVDRLVAEDDILAFMRAFRELIRIHNVLTSFTEFSDDDLSLDAQRFEDFKSKYLDIHDRMKADRDDDQKASILNEVDFELELIRRDNINVAYILALLASVVAEQQEAEEAVDTAGKTKTILDLLGSELRLRSKRELIEEFITAYLPTMWKRRCKIRPR